MNGPASGGADRPLRFFLVAGEESGDQLGAALMRALKRRVGVPLSFTGVGGDAMASEGLASLFPLRELTVMGIVAVVARLPALLRRIRETADTALRTQPDALIIIDSPDFTHRVARRVRAAAPGIPIVDYVSPSVWAWRPGRARAMRAYVDHVMALLPFEPAAHVRLGGPPCTYVGHPLTGRVHELRPNADEARRRAEDPPLLLLLPGSRRSEVRRLLPAFAGAVERLVARSGAPKLVLPTVPHLADEIAAATRTWLHRPRITVDPGEKCAAMRTARAALAASGTVTLELALAGVPMVGAYRLAAAEAMIARRVIRVPSVILANLVLGENVVPELLQGDCTPDRLAAALAPLFGDTAERRRQTEAIERLDGIMQNGSAEPDERAADIVLALARAGRA